MPRHKKHIFRLLPAFAVLTICLALILSACGAARYKIDTCGMDFLYDGVKKRGYRAGEEVTVFFPGVALDMDYTFYLDGGPVDYGYDDDGGFAIRFTMPEHDVTLDFDAKESITYVP